MATGIMMFVSFHLLFLNLSASMNGMYEDRRFADAFARVGGIPLSAAQRLESVPGVERAQAGITADVRVLREGFDRAVTLRLSSFDPAAEEPLNEFELAGGALPGEDGILLGKAFAQAGGYSVGDTVELVLRGQKVIFIVSGLVQSPEYVYAIPDTGQLMPDNATFGFGYVNQERLAALAGMEGMANSLSFLLKEGYSYSRAEPYLEESLARYSLLALYGRENQPSHAMLSQEVDSIGAMSSSLPMVFILLAVVILYIMMRRMIQQERTQIGTMRAFGLSGLRVIAHYLSYGGVLGAAGGVTGLALGLLMTDAMTGVYLEFFSLPALRVPPDPGIMISGAGIAVFAGIAGAFMGARSVLRLLPGEAMRPESPPGVTGDLLKRLPFLRLILSSLGFMAIRNISRNRFRSGFVVVGVAFSFALTAFMASFHEMFDVMIFDQLTKVELYNLKISLSEPAAYTPALESARALEGVRRAEGLLELSAELAFGHLSKTAPLTGIKAGSSLYRIYDSDTRAHYPPPTEGLLLSASLAERLKVKRGDLLAIKTPYTGDETFCVPVAGVFTSSLGAAAYMEMDALRKALSLPEAVTSVILDASSPGAIREELLDSQAVSAVVSQEEALSMYEDLIGEYAYLINMMSVSGAIVAFAIITNSAGISLSERKREYATMRVMGMHPAEIGTVVGFEYWSLTLLAFPLGILLTGCLKRGVAGMINNDIFTIPLYTAPSSYIIAGALCCAAVFLSNRSARRKIARFDMVEVLKERE
jgi:putative ABC transport system permease protein